MFFVSLYNKLKRAWEYIVYPSKYYAEYYAKKYTKQYMDSYHSDIDNSSSLSET